MIQIFDDSQGKRLRAVPSEAGVDVPVTGPVSWSVSDPSILTITAPAPEGPDFARLTRAGGLGVATVTAVYGNLTATEEYEVLVKPVVPDALRIETAELE